MSDDARALTAYAASDYDAIAQAVMETARGRWFLREYAARNRNADTNVLLDAIGKLEKAVSGEQMSRQIERVRFDLLEMATTISRLKSELAPSSEDGQEQSHFDEATSALDDIVQTTERATSNILESAEAIQEVAWSLREQQVDEDVCERIDKLATDIYTACAFQDLTAQRTQKVVRTLRFLEGRINGLIDAWAGKDEAAAPTPPRPAAPTPAVDLSQSDVDIVIVDNEIQGLADDIGIPPSIDTSLAFAEALTDIEQRAAIEVESMMVADVELVEVDDADGDDIIFVNSDSDQIEDLTRKPAPTPPVRQPSLAEIDAMPTTAKALIFG